MCLRQKLCKESGSKPAQNLFISLGIDLNTEILFLGRNWKKAFVCIYVQKYFTPNQQEGLWALETQGGRQIG